MRTNRKPLLIAAICCLAAMMVVPQCMAYCAKCARLQAEQRAKAQSYAAAKHIEAKIAPAKEVARDDSNCPIKAELEVPLAKDEVVPLSEPAVTIAPAVKTEESPTVIRPASQAVYHRQECTCAPQQRREPVFLRFRRW